MEENEIQSSSITNLSELDQSLVLEPANGEFIPTEDEQFVETANESIGSESAFVQDDSTTGIIKLYFAKQSLVATGSVPGEGGQYQFNRSKVYNASTANRYTKQNDAEHIFENTKSDLDAKNEFTTVEDIFNSIPNSFVAPFTLRFPSFKMQPEYEKIEQAPLGAEVFVFAKTVELDNQEITINIKEKEPLLLDGEGDVNVVLVEGEEGNEQEGEETTDLKATVEDGQAAIKIKLKPKDENDDGSTPNLDDWKRRISGIVEDGTYTYIPNRAFTVDNESELRSISQTIVDNSHSKGLGTEHFIYVEDVIEILTPSGNPPQFGTIRYSSVPGIPKYIKKDHEYEEYTYTFVNPNGTSLGSPSDNQKERFAEIIQENIEEGKKINQPNIGDNPKLKTDVFIKKEDILQSLSKFFYERGETISFRTYKNLKPLLWLKAEASGQEKEDLNQSGEEEESYFELAGNTCSCNRDLTLDELDTITKTLSWNNSAEIFTGASNLQDRSKVNFLRELNSTLEKYDINTCIRKVHFLAQVYHETGALRLTEEGVSGRQYDPRQHPDAKANGNTEVGDGPKYKGRGLLQLTWKHCYMAYKGYSGIDVVTNYRLVSDNLKLAVDSAGWYWSQGKRLLLGDEFVLGENTYTKLDGSVGDRFPKRTFSYDGISYGNVDLSLLADKDYINTISWLINGGSNGLEERREYLKKLKVMSFFRCQENSNDDWHDPVLNPISTNYFQNGGSGTLAQRWGLFGDDIRREVDRKHTGLDLFATTGTNIFACVDGTVYNRRWHSGYGNTITIKVKDPNSFLQRKRTDYIHKTNREMKNGRNWDETGDIFLFYAHLHTVKNFNFGDEVKCGDILGTTGRSGISAGTHAPHLHFEIFCKYRMAVGTDFRFNPAYFVEYKFYDEQTENDKSQQSREINRGQITEVNGSGRLSASDIF